MLLFDCGGGEERGGDADVRNYTRIRNPCHRFGNKNQHLTELKEFAIHSFYEIL